MPEIYSDTEKKNKTSIGIFKSKNKALYLLISTGNLTLSLPSSPGEGNLPNPGIEPRSPTLQVDSLPAEPQGSPRILGWVAYPFSSRSSHPRN